MDKDAEIARLKAAMERVETTFRDMPHGMEEKLCHHPRMCSIQAADIVKRIRAECERAAQETP